VAEAKKPGARKVAGFGELVLKQQLYRAMSDEKKMFVKKCKIYIEEAVRCCDSTVALTDNGRFRLVGTQGNNAPAIFMRSCSGFYPGGESS